MSVSISVVLATRNRSAYARKAVRSLAGQTLPWEAYEILLVDNGSEDDTSEVVNEFSDLPNLLYLHEPVPGLSRARNTGWSNAAGEYIAFMDDDAIAAPDWLEATLATFESFEPVPGIVGGRCDPIWEAPRPSWLGDNMLAILSVYNWSDTATVLSDRQWLSACNMAIRRELLQQIGGFREDLGRRGDRVLANGEAYLQLQARRLDVPIVYDPGVAVQHHISARRLTKEWFRRARYGYGVSGALTAGQDAPLSLPARLWMSAKAALWGLPRAALMLLEGTEAQRFRRQCQVLEAIGYVDGLWSWQLGYEKLKG